MSARGRRPRRPRGASSAAGPSQGGDEEEEEPRPTFILPPGLTLYHVQCPLCRELLNDPRELPCGHPSCFLCIGNNVTRDNQIQCRACKTISKLGGLGAFALPQSSLAPLVQHLRQDQNAVKAVRSLPIVSTAAAPSVAPPAASPFDPAPSPFGLAPQQPAAAVQDKYSVFRTVDATPHYPSVAAPAPSSYSSAPPAPSPFSDLLSLEPAAAPPRSPLVPSSTPIAPTVPPLLSAAPAPRPQPAAALPPVVPFSAPVYAPRTAPAPAPAPFPSAVSNPPLSPSSSTRALAPTGALPVPAPASASVTKPPEASPSASPAPETSFLSRAAALFGSISLGDAEPPKPAPRPDGKPLAAPPARPHPPELLSALSAQPAPPPASAPEPSAVPAAAPSIYDYDASAPVAAAESDELDMFYGLSAGQGQLQAPPPPEAKLSRADVARQKREALKQKKADEAEQMRILREREKDLEQQQRWEMQRSKETQNTPVMQQKLAELQERNRKENAEREAKLRRQKEQREEHRRVLLAADPSAAGTLSASVPDASAALNFAEFTTRTEDLRNLFNAWARELWFAPDDLLSKAIFGPISPSYAPFYVFEAKTVSQYTGQVCKSGEQIGPGGEKKLVDSWSPVAGIYKGSYNNILVCAAVGEDAKYLCALKNWDVNKVYYEGEPRKQDSSGDSFASKFFKAVVDAIPKVRPVRDQLLPAEAWQIVWHEYEEHFVRPVEERQCAAKILAEERGKGVSSVKVATTYDVTRKLVYFPVYLCSYTYENKSYRFVVHGQNSSLEAERPYGLGVVGTTAKQGLEMIGSFFRK